MASVHYEITTPQGLVAMNRTGYRPDLSAVVDLEVVLQERELLGGLAPVTDNSAGALHDLLGMATLVELAETDPLAELLTVSHLHQGHVALLAKGLNQAHVGGVLARRSENAQASLAAVQELSALAEATHDTVVVEGLLEHTLDGVHERHGTGRGSCDFSGNFFGHY